MKTNWQTKKLGKVCEVIAGQSPEGKFYNKIGNGLPFYQGKKEFTEKFIGEPTTWTTEITKEAQAGDILMSVRAPVGPINFATEKICIGRGLAEQKRIVSKLDTLSAETKKLESIYKQKLADLEEFKKSILKKAFNGEL